MSIEILKAGMLTTIQDAGRYGYQQYGVTVSGSMDVYHHHLANVLVGNPLGTEVIECTMLPPVIRFQQGNYFSITGATVQAKCNGKPIETHRAYRAETGDVLELSAVQAGCRTYLAFAGGLNVPAVMGSRSTFLKGKLGGLEGRALQVGDVIAFRAPRTELPNLPFRSIPKGMQYTFPKEQTIRVILGPQEQDFAKEGIDTFLQNPYKVTLQADRMGYRLEGEPITHAKGHDGNIISDAITKGAIQVPGEGQLIIMMADRQTTGGYSKIAHVISVDLPKVAQLCPGDTVHFVACTIEEAHRLLRERTQSILGLQSIWNQHSMVSMQESVLYTAQGKTYGRVMQLAE